MRHQDSLGWVIKSQFGKALKNSDQSFHLQSLISAEKEDVLSCAQLNVFLELAHLFIATRGVEAKKTEKSISKQRR